MTDSLRDRIAKVLAVESAIQGQDCDWAILADAVIRELGLEVTATAKASDGRFKSLSVEGYWEERKCPAQECGDIDCICDDGRC